MRFLLLVSTGDFESDMESLKTRLAAKGPKPTHGGAEAETANSGGTTESRIPPDAKLPASVDVLESMRVPIGSVSTVARDPSEMTGTNRTQVIAAIQEPGDVPYTVYALDKADFASKSHFEEDKVAAVEKRQESNPDHCCLSAAGRTISKCPSSRRVEYSSARSRSGHQNKR